MVFLESQQVQKQLPNRPKRAETMIVLIVFDGVAIDPGAFYYVHDQITLQFIDPFISTKNHTIAG